MISDTQNAINQASSSLRQFSQKTQGKEGEMNKSDFLNLFMTQVSNQDPLSPMDSAGMMSQISQMGTMEQLQNLNTKMDQMIGQGKNLLKVNSGSFIGMEVSFRDNTIPVSGGEAASVSYRLSEDTGVVVASIIDQDGNMVDKISMPQKTKGLHRFTWNGMNDKNETVADGSYLVEFLAVGKNGKEVRVDTNRTKRIDRIGYKNNTPLFHLGEKTMTLDEINMFDRKSAGRFANAVPFGIEKNSSK